MRSDWLVAMREVPVAAAAEALGYEVSHRHARQEQCACPVCGQDKRHTKSGDRRGAVSIVPDGLHWHCFQCEAGGDAVDFVAAVVGGEKFRALSPELRDEVRLECETLLAGEDL